MRAALGEEADWDVATHLLATIADQATAANYQRSGKRMPSNAVIKRPGQVHRQETRKAESNSQPKGWDDLNAMWG